MKRCKGCGRGFEGVGEWCGSDRCEATRRRSEGAARGELAEHPDVLLKETLDLRLAFLVVRETSGLAMHIRDRVRAVPYDNVFGLLQLSDEELRWFGARLPAPLADKLHNSCVEFEFRSREIRSREKHAFAITLSDAGVSSSAHAE